MGAPRSAVTPMRVVSANSVSHREVPDSVPAYSTTKFLALQAYCRSASSWRMLWTCLTLPLPALLFAVVPAMLPLKRPREGVTVWYTRHGSCITISAFLGAAMHYTSGTGLAQAGFFRKILGVAIIGAILSITDLTIMQVYWKVPVPFGLIIFTTMGFVDIGIALVLVLGRSLWELSIFLRSVKVYAPNMSIQMTQIIFYPAFSVLYDKANNTQRILLTLVFPIVKYGLKRLLKRSGRQLGEYQTEVAVSGVEICASLYQSIFMQAVPTTAAMAVIMGIDLVQGIIAIKFFADRLVDASMVRHKIFDEAEQLMTMTFVAPTTMLLAKDQSPGHKHESQDTINRALQLANVAESILLVEYFEVIIPIVNGVFLLVAAQFPSARFNSSIAPLYNDRDQLKRALWSLMLYSALQGLSCVAMHVVMKRRYGISAIAHLSFVLERYHTSILGKMLTWLPII